MMKKIICVVLIVALLCPALAMAEALRVDPKAVSKEVDRTKDTDVFFEEFTSVEPGALPSCVPTVANVTTAEYEVSKGYVKNCLEITDPTHAQDYSGTSATLNFPKISEGVFEFEVRYKYIPTETSTYNSFDMGLYDAVGNKAHRLCVASDNGATNFNYGGKETTTLEKKRIDQNTWYTYKLAVSFEDQVISGTLKNEGTGETSYKANAQWMDGKTHDSLVKFIFMPQVYGGIWVIDYVRISEVTADSLDVGEDPYANIKKGVEQIKTPAPVNGPVDGRINIIKNGVYKYVTSAPYVSESTGNVMMTAKNFAQINGMGYLRQGDEFTLTKGDKVVKFTAGSAEVTVGEETVSIKENTVRKSNQLYVPVESLCEVFGYSFAYDAPNLAIIIEN